MNNGFFVTGTDTEVGKTIVTRAIIRALVRKNKKVASLKPIESGAPMIDGKLVPVDATALIKAAKSDANIDDVCCYSFPDPVSPHLAAMRVGEKIELEPILKLLNNRKNNFDIVIAEGAGGLLVPLSDDLIYADVIAKSGFGLIIVSPNVLGTINATLLTIEAARNRGIDVVGVVLNQTPQSELGNAQAIEHYGKVKVLGEFPTVSKKMTNDLLADYAEDTLNLSFF